MPFYSRDYIHFVLPNFIILPYQASNATKWYEDDDNSVYYKQLEEKYTLESTDPRESEIRAPRQLTIALKLSYYLFIIAKLFKVKGVKVGVEFNAPLDTK